jgi:hypothetical protein
MLIARDLCSHQPDGDFLTGGDVRRAANDLQGFMPNIHPAHGESVRTGVFLAADHVSDNEAAIPVSRTVDGSDFESQFSQTPGEVVGRDPEGEVFFEPAFYDFHGRVWRR